MFDALKPIRQNTIKYDPSNTKICDVETLEANPYKERYGECLITTTTSTTKITGYF